MKQKEILLNLEAEVNKAKAENIAVVIWNILRPLINQKLDLKIVLYETERNFVEFGG